ncbi:GntR family transcriptional regulator [Basfia succiniciproducens]|uniref:GntR family transcriptional regulator n=1 Tax=Basfia succiniciproducens TaxID=653940 RepID=UPI0008BC33C9|nr:GntR family transcriptional regulator [Basfia succiniciproducens]SEQ09425.1 DNA-binding transcriptional regulator, GntR family [Basfia succiniciproducens]
MKNSTNLLKDIIYLRIHNMIISGILPMGQKISESVLIDRLNATKAPVRDAIKRLEAERLVVIKPKSGTFVFNVTDQELEELLEFRYCLESNAMRLACIPNCKCLVQELRLILDKMLVSYERGQIDEYLKLDYDFHNVIIANSHNPYYIDAYSLVAARMAAIRVHLGSNQEHTERSLRQHENIIKALELNKVDLAVNELLQHISPKHGAYWSITNIKQ